MWLKHSFEVYGFPWMGIFSFQPTKYATNWCDMGWIMWWHTSPENKIISPPSSVPLLVFHGELSQPWSQTLENSLGRENIFLAARWSPQHTVESCVNSGSFNVWLIKSKGTIPSNPLLLSLDQEIQPERSRESQGESMLWKTKVCVYVCVCVCVLGGKGRAHGCDLKVCQTRGTWWGMRGWAKERKNKLKTQMEQKFPV